MEYGVCIWNVVPVRSEPADTAELCTQLLFGDAYQIQKVTEDKKWMLITILEDDYEGWIDFKQHHETSEAVAKNNDITYVQELGGYAFYAEKKIPLLQGSMLRDYLNSQFSLGQYEWAFNGEVGLATKEQLIEKAMSFLGAPYLWGGKTMFGIDCSGLVQIVYRLCGISLPRDAYQQEEKGESVNFQQQQKGDLAFFSNAKGRVTHVGILIDNQKIIHAHGEVRIDTLDEKGIYNADRQVYTHFLSGIKRVI